MSDSGETGAVGHDPGVGGRRARKRARWWRSLPERCPDCVHVGHLNLASKVCAAEKVAPAWMCIGLCKPDTREKFNDEQLDVIRARIREWIRIEAEAQDKPSPRELVVTPGQGCIELIAHFNLTFFLSEEACWRK